MLSDATGAAVPGNVEVFAWPTGRPVEVGQSVQLTPVGSGHAAKDGRFSVSGDLSPQLAELAAGNGGYVNFVLEAATGGGLEELHFSRYVGGAEYAAQQAEGGRDRKVKVEWRASPDDAAEGVHVSVPEARTGRGTAEDRQIRPIQGGCYGLTLVDSQVGYTVIGELRAPQDTLEAFFAYGKRADSEIGVAARGSQGPWETAGSFHIANNEDTNVTQWADSGQHLLDLWKPLLASTRRKQSPNRVGLAATVSGAACGWG